METLIFLAVVFLIFVTVLAREIYDGKKQEQKLKKEILENWGSVKKRSISQAEMEQISYFSAKNQQDETVDDLTWKDLDMDEVFKNMAYTRSSAGDEYLYYMLRNPLKNKEMLLQRQEKISALADREIAGKLQLILTKMGRLKKLSMLQYLEHLFNLEEEKNTRYYIADFLLLFSFFVMTVHLGIGLAFFFLMVFYQMVTYFRIKAKLDLYLSSLRYLFSMMYHGNELIQNLPSPWEKEKEALGKVLKMLAGLKQNSFLLLSPGRMSGQGFELILDYIRMIFHLDIIKFNSIMGKVRGNAQEIRSLYEGIGEIDACLSIAEYRETLAFWAIPEFGENKELSIRQGYHPLLQNPVPNDLVTEKCILLTGSNASGKSTFLKMLGINILMAQSVGVCFAAAFRLPFCSLLTCLSLRDCVLRSESYYMAEIRAIKRIFDAAKETYVIAMVDEVLRGTNTMERIAASTEILKHMAKKDILMFAATHDRELTITLQEEYDNYHFEEIAGSKDVEFSFLLKPGRADTSNAIRLLEYTGYDTVIVENARKRLKNFETRGEWM